MLGRVKRTEHGRRRSPTWRPDRAAPGRDYPNENAGFKLGSSDFREVLNRSVRAPLAGAAGRCCSGAPDCLRKSGQPASGARGARQGEFTVRLALGARRSRIVRQLISETMPIAVSAVWWRAAGDFGAALFLRIAPSTLPAESR